MFSIESIAWHLGGHHHGSDHSHEHGRGGGGEYAPPLVELSRGGLTESLHRGAVAVCGPDGVRTGGLGHPAMPTFMRSTAKPFQALPVITSGAADHFGFTPDEIACMCGSLGGQDFQVAAVRSILAKAGLDEGLLACGVHRPLHGPTARALHAAGEKPKPIHNACAGKHAGMLALCAHLGHPVEGYTGPAHPLQRLMLETVARVCRYPAEQIGLGVDGCGVPVFRLPLIALAGGYARLAAPQDSGLAGEDVEGLSRLLAACLGNPEMVAGEGRLCTRVMQAAPGTVLAKTGTEGVYALALPGLSKGVAIQVEDGSMRALGPVVCEALHQLGVLDHDVLDGDLADLHQPELNNHLGQPVARLAPVFSL